jgi:hypothetical protein
MEFVVEGFEVFAAFVVFGYATAASLGEEG